MAIRPEMVAIWMSRRALVKMVHRWSKCLSTHRQIVRMVRFREEVLLDGFG